MWLNLLSHSMFLPRLAFLNAKSLVRLYANPAVTPQKISNNFGLHQVFLVIDSKWRTNFILHEIANYNKTRDSQYYGKENEGI